MNWHPYTAPGLLLLTIVGVLHLITANAVVSAWTYWQGYSHAIGIYFTHVPGEAADPTCDIIPEGLRSSYAIELGIGLATVRITWFGSIPST